MSEEQGYNKQGLENTETKIDIEKFALKAPKNKGRKESRVNIWINQKSKKTKNLREEYYKIIENLSSNVPQKINS